MTIVVLTRAAESLAALRQLARPDDEDLVVFSGSPVEVGDPDPGLDVRFVPDFANRATVELNVLALAETTAVSAIWISDPRDAVRAGALRDYLAIPGQGRDSAVILRDLVVLRQVLDRAGVAVVRTVPIRMAADVYLSAHRLGYPLAVRQRHAPGWPVLTVLRAHADVVRFTADGLGVPDGSVPSMLVEVAVSGVRHRLPGTLEADGPVLRHPDHAVDQADRPLGHRDLGHDLAVAAVRALPVPPGARFTVDLLADARGDLVVDTVDVMTTAVHPEEPMVAS